MCRPRFRRLEVQKAPGCNYQGSRPRGRKVLELAGYQVISTCGMRAFQKNIVVRAEHALIVSVALWQTVCTVAPITSSSR